MAQIWQDHMFDHISQYNKKNNLRRGIRQETAENKDADIEAALGLLKLKRIFRDKTYREQGYRYKNEMQINVLNDVLQITPYPNAQTRDSLGILLNLNPRSVQIWFQNARQVGDRQMSRDELKYHKESTNVDLSVLLEIYKKYNK